MLVGEAGVSDTDKTPEARVRSLRLQVPDGVPTEDAVDALQVASISLRKSQAHEEGPILGPPNKASKKLMGHVEESYDLMAESLIREISKVLAEGEADEGR